ncbi:hypothetical protein D3C72_1108560 [compost metagenome]
MKHPFLVLNDNIRCAKIQKTFQPVVPVNYTAVQVVKVRRCKTPTIELNHRTKFRRDDRKNVQNHPFRLIARIAERFDYFKTFDCPVTALTLSSTQFFLKEIKLFLHVDILQKLFDSFGTHTGLEAVAVFLTVAAVFLLGQELLFLKRRIARICYNI